MKSNRIPLPNGTKLSTHLTITQLLSNAGQTALTYLATTKDNEHVVVKEMFPFESDNEYYRDGYQIFVKRKYEKNHEEERRQEREFIKECENTSLIGAIENQEAMIAFVFEDITQEVRKNIEFQGTIARYCIAATIHAKTLHEIMDTQEISFTQALVYTRSILEATDQCHSKEQRVHLDVTCDTILCLGKENGESIRCALLDCGSVKKIEEISVAMPRIETNRYSSKEMRKRNHYSRVGNRANVIKYTDFLGFQSDLFSIGTIAFHLITQKTFDEMLWQEISETESTTKKQRLIKQALSKVRNITSPEFLDKLCGIFSRALYFSPSKEQSSINRYNDCKAFMDDIDHILHSIENHQI